MRSGWPPLPHIPRITPPSNSIQDIQILQNKIVLFGSFNSNGQTPDLLPQT